MTFLSKELGIATGRPVHLIELTQGPQTWRYTSTPYSLVRLGETWMPTPWLFSSITQSNEMAKDSLQLKFPLSHPFASTFLGYATPDLVTTLTLFRGHEDDTDEEFITYWKGRVLSFTSSGKDISLECEPVFTSLKRPGLRARYQRNCRHALYGRGCNLTASSFQVSGTLDGVSGKVLTVNAASASPSGYYTGGMIETPDGFLRYIADHTGSTISLMRLAKNLPAQINGSVLLFPGCDHTLYHCGNRFNNVLNFGGFPWIPTRNPLDGSSIA